MRNRFDAQLHSLDEQLTHMGELCETAIAKATQALKDGSVEQAKIIISEDEEIDQCEKDIERLCLKLLLQQQPVAKDLRRISAALKMITDMERIGDQTADIAEIIISSKSGAAADEIRVIGTMASEVSKMVRNSVTAYVNRDLELAQSVMKADDEIDQYFEEVRDEMIEFIKDEKGQNGKRIFDLRAYRRPCDQHCRVGGILHHRRAQRQRDHSRGLRPDKYRDKGELENDILRGR